MKIALCVCTFLLLWLKALPQSCDLLQLAPQTVCAGSSATIRTAVKTGEVSWFNEVGEKVHTGYEFTTPVLTESITYFLERSMGSCTSDRMAVRVYVSPSPANPVVTGPLEICAGTSTTLTASGSDGLYEWYESLTDTVPLIISPDFTSPKLSSTVTYYVQARLGNCISQRVPVNIVVKAPVETPAAADTVVIAGQSATLTAKGTGTIYWYATLSSQNPVQTGSVFTTPVLQNSVSYFIEAEVNGCRSDRKAVSVTVMQAPLPPAATDVTICSGSSAVLQAFGRASRFNWYDSAAGGNLLATGDKFETLLLTAGKDYFVEAEISGFRSERKKVTVSVITSVPAPTTQGAMILQGQEAVLRASGPEGEYIWYDAPVGGNAVRIGREYRARFLSGQTFYVEVAVGSCISPRTPVVVIVDRDDTPAELDVVPAPVAADVTICYGERAEITASADYGIVHWFDTQNGEWPFLRSPTYVTEKLFETTVFYLEANFLNKPSQRTKVTVTVLPEIAAPRLESAAICIGTPAVLRAEAEAGRIEWYDAPEDGTLVFTGNAFSIPNPASSAVFYVQAVLEGCKSKRVPVSLSVGPPPKVISNASGEVCSGIELKYQILADRPEAKYIWSRKAVAGIANPAVSSQTGATISEVLVNTTSQPVVVQYEIIPSVSGCQGPSFLYNVLVQPIGQLTSPKELAICSSGSADYTPVFNLPVSSFTWSRAASPGISSRAVSGQAFGTIRETLINTSNEPVEVIYRINPVFETCDGPEQIFTLTVNPVARVIGSLSSTVCTGTESAIRLHSNVSGARFKWRRAANAAISNPAAEGEVSDHIRETLENTASVPVNVVYEIIPLINGCEGPLSTYILTVNPADRDVLDAGPDRVVCSDDPRVQLSGAAPSGATVKWSSTGSGIFKPSADVVDAVYVPSADDIRRGSMTLTMFKTGSGLCQPPSDFLEVRIVPVPGIQPDTLIYALQGTPHELKPRLTENSGLTFQWLPATGLSDATSPTPVFNGTQDQTYRLVVTNDAGCRSEIEVEVAVLKPIAVPNAFTPNGDGANDVWNVAELPKYPQATVTVFNRQGAVVFRSDRYSRSWDGTTNGSSVPAGTYYYVIDTRYHKPFTGYVSVIR